MYHLVGRIDEHAVFDSLASLKPPLKLNIGKISSINSVGVRRFLAFSLAWSPKKFEFYECTPEFIANVNVIPQLLGMPSDEAQIRTFYVPFSCETCKRMENVLFERAQVKFDERGEPIIPGKSCAKCGEALDLDVEKTEFFLFLKGDQV